MTIKRVSIIGLGALGILFGQQLAKKMAKADLRFIADQDRINRYTKEGVFCNGEACDFNFVSPEEQVEPADLILFTVKQDGLEQAIQSVKHHVGEHTIILSALNGISSEAIIGEAYGHDRVLYCVAQGMDAVKVGNELTYHNKGMLCFGDKEPGVVSDKVKQVAQFFDSVDIPYEAVTDMLHRLWGKFMLNVGVNQTCAVERCHYGDVQREGKERDTMIAAMREVIVLSQKEGYPLSEADLDYWLTVLGTLNPTGKPSMAQDVDAKRKSEVDLFAGTVLTLAKKHGILTPTNQYLYDRVKAIESTY
ncbi:ketopantoate reductase family protein [Pullulanibacillus sp. KACC 23026]|uniref:ketopantoate reductase family protein n=1 Tax=Pullulanibacillus sp. KACC 23026 TaxID=3028315 RepID=UPI0023B1654E|nr:ketopantoate reductase family protein [Pullulanibacillus sp. KACC 23026]WEG12345.1 ketopantoate reductase family protein [Pullulanibacillus sp. KACC 23026]